MVSRQAQKKTKTYGTLTIESGSTYTGDILNNKPHGNGYANRMGGRSLYRGEWKNGKYDGQGTLYGPIKY